MARWALPLLFALTLLGADAPKHVKSPTASQAFTSAQGAAAVWVDPAKWTRVQSTQENVRTFMFYTGQAQARLITSNESRTPDVQLEETLERIRKNDPEARVVFSEPRNVNDVDLLCVQIETALTEDTKAIYFGYLFGDSERTVQLFVVTEQSVLSRFFKDFTVLLDGLVVEGPNAGF